MKRGECFSIVVSRCRNPTTVQKLIDAFKSNFRGGLLESVDDFEKRIQVYEQQSGETVTDNLSIGCVVAGLEKSSLKEHWMVVGAKAKVWAVYKGSREHRDGEEVGAGTGTDAGKCVLPRYV